MTCPFMPYSLKTYKCNLHSKGRVLWRLVLLQKTKAVCSWGWQRQLSLAVILWLACAIFRYSRISMPDESAARAPSIFLPKLLLKNWRSVHNSAPKASWTVGPCPVLQPTDRLKSQGPHELWASLNACLEFTTLLSHSCPRKNDSTQ